MPDLANDVRQLLRTLPVPAWAALDAQCHQVICNIHAERLLPGSIAWSPASSPPQSAASPRFLKDGRLLAASELPLFRAIEQAAPIEGFRADVELPGGRRLSLRGSATPLLDADNRVTGALLIFVDVTPAAKSPTPVLDNDRLLSELAHELRGPMNAVLTWMTLLESGRLGKDEQQAAYESVRRSIRGQERVVSELLDLSRLSKESVTMDPVEADLTALTTQAIGEIRLLLGERRIDLECRPDARPLLVIGDAARLRHALTNVLSYVARSIPEGDEVEVVCARAERHGVITVGRAGHQARRGGPAIPLQKLEMALAHRIFELHGGEISVWDDQSGGVSIDVHMPLAPQAWSGPKPAPLPSSQTWSLGDGLAGLHILLVEDHPVLREAMLGLLSACGARVSAAGNAPEALECYRQERPDALLCDLSMPGEDGYSLLEKIRAEDSIFHRPALPAIALSAYDDREHRAHSLAVGFHAYVTKPAGPEELVEAIWGALAESKHVG